jgi:hypothetical protein
MAQLGLSASLPSIILIMKMLGIPICSIPARFSFGLERHLTDRQAADILSRTLLALRSYGWHQSLNLLA